MAPTISAVDLCPGRYKDAASTGHPERTGRRLPRSRSAGAECSFRHSQNHVQPAAAAIFTEVRLLVALRIRRRSFNGRRRKKLVPSGFCSEGYDAHKGFDCMDLAGVDFECFPNIQGVISAER